MEEAELKKFAEDAVSMWDVHQKAFVKNLPKHGKSARALNPDHINSGTVYKGKTKERMIDRTFRYIGQGHAIMFSTVSELNLRAVPLQSRMTPDRTSIWPGEEALMNCDGMTMVVCPDGKAVLLCGGRKVLVLATDEHREEIESRIASVGSFDEADSILDGDKNLDAMFGGPQRHISGMTLSTPTPTPSDPETLRKMFEIEVTAQNASKRWAQILEIRDGERKITPKAVRNGIPAIAWESRKGKAIWAFKQEIKKGLHSGETLVYSTDKKWNDVVANPEIIDELREEMKNSGKHVAMVVEQGKITVFSSSERVIYQSDESKAREASAGASSGDPD